MTADEGSAGPPPPRAFVSAMGGTRSIPAPDAIAADYLLLALRLDQHVPGIVDAYYGPASIKANVDMEQLRGPARLRDDAVALRERLASEVAEPERRAWLDAQLIALEAQAAVLAGEPMPYLELVTRCMGMAPTRHGDASFAAARAAIDELIPGDGALADRLEAFDRALTIGVERLPAVCDWLVARFRAAAGRDLGLPAGEELRVAFVTNQPWGAYHWFDGGGRSRVDINTDRPVWAPGLPRMMAQATYPGHHLEQAWKEAELIDGRGWLEASVLLMNTPAYVVSEGLANVGVTIAVPPAEAVDLYVELFDRAGLPVAGDRANAHATAERCVALAPARAALHAIHGDAALLRHADGRSTAQVLTYLRDVGGFTADGAASQLGSIDHPLVRPYLPVSADGDGLVGRWLEAGPPAERAARFGRLLREPVTPASILAEMGQPPG